MPEVRWTKAQKNAINARGGSVLVSAAAGSGKTAVLVQRIIDSITDTETPVSIDRMLIVTFTRAASAEMRSRIEKALNNLLKKDPYNSYLLNQKQLLYSAKISTIDGFCTEFVRQYFYKLNIQSDFRIADEGELNILRSKALDNSLEKFYSGNSDEFKNLLNSTCTYRNDDNLRKHILNTYNFLTSIPFMYNWMKKMLSYYEGMPFMETPYYYYLINRGRDCVSYCNSLLTSCYNYIETDEYLKPEQLDKIRTTLDSDRLFFEKLNNSLSSGNWNEIKCILECNKFARFPIIKDSNDDSNKELIKSLRDNYKSEIKKLNDIFDKDISKIENNTKENYPVIKTFFNCIKAFKDEFTKLKNEKNILDFADIEGLMVELLCENVNGEIVYTDISGEISAMFDAVMVDEFQDINEVQDLIFKAVSGNKNNIFVVGDVKQSIYGFRQAKPDIFLGYKNEYKEYSPDSEEYPAKIILDKNFRSRKGITEACNFIFSTLMSENVGGLEYGDEEKLVCGASYIEDDNLNMELMLINSSEIDEENNETELTVEACTVAEKIYKLIFDEKLRIKDGDSTRDITYGDIAILLRSPRGDTRRAVTFVNTLNQYAIPTVSEEKNSFFDSPEIKLMLNMLRIIDNPMQDIPLLSVMLSPMFSFTADDAAKLRINDRKSPLYLAVKKSKDNKCKNFINFLDKMRTLSVTTTVDRLIGIILSITAFDCVAMAGDKFNEKNLYLLQDYARSYAGNGYKTLTSFINYIDRMKERGTFLNSAGDVADSSINAVKVMSIHASKGLEFPVCFLSSSSTEFNLRDASNDLVLNNEYGIGLRFKRGILKYDTTERKALALMQKDLMLSEEMRILYVALTRAKERLIITAVNKAPEKYLLKLESKIPAYPISPYVVKGMSSYSDWLFTCALTNPSCDIRKIIKPDFTYFKDSYKPWIVDIINKKSEIKVNSQNADKQSNIKSEASIDKDFLKNFINRVNYNYPYKSLSALPQKVSASELSHKDNRIFNKILRKPSFLTEKKSSGAEKGTAFHNFMERCDLASARKDVSLEAERLKAKGFLTERQVKLIEYDKLRDFLNSSLIDRVINSESYEREFQFTVKINAEDYNSDFKSETLIMQGAIDLFFIENNEVVIVDYKTDRVKDSSDLIKLYHKQLELYKSAIEEISGLNVKEAVIYSIHLGEEIIIQESSRN